MAESVFILGSGFSKDIAGYPVMNELSKIVMESMHNNDEQIELPGIWGGRFEFAIPPAIARNIEHMLTYLFQSYPWRGEMETNLSKAGYQFIARIIERKINRFENNFAEKGCDHGGIKKLLEIWHETKAIVITFNYDTLIERLVNMHLVQKGYDIPTPNLYGIPISHVNSRTVSTMHLGQQEETFRLLKLHGSTNWFFSGVNDYPGEQIYFSDPAFHEQDHLSERNISDLVPLIIPPVLDKSPFYFNNGIKYQWRLAKKALVEAKKIYVIGYSLPITDLSTRFLLQEALTKSGSELILVTKYESEESAADLRNRYLELVDGKETRITTYFIDEPEGDYHYSSSVDLLVEEILQIRNTNL